MKAVILAGGEGARLRPVSLGLPKPMTPLFDKPVMEHTIALLKRFGMTEICVTLAYMPQAVIEYFGDGAKWGVKLTYFVERKPLGTAGSVKACMKALGDEDFLVMSGDAVCDFDLTAAIGYHRSRRCAATLVLARQSSPLEYGLVVTDETGRVERFVEKPSWGQVVTERVNTGIYLLTKKAMDLVPEGESFDFGRDLFPLLLRNGETLYGWEGKGYWRDMGSCGAYRSCVDDVLEGKVKLDLDAEERSGGIWSAESIPAGVEVLPPCYIGKNVRLGQGSRIGPGTVLGAGSSVGENTLVERSVVHGASIGERSTVYGAILCKDSRVGTDCVLDAGSVLGEGAQMEEGSVLAASVRVWPHRRVAPGARLRTSLVNGESWESLKFSDGGVIRGVVGEDLTPESMLLLGGVLSENGCVGLGRSGGGAAEMLADSIHSGLTAAGCRVMVHDASCAAAAAWLGENFTLPLSLFVEQEGERIYLSLFDRKGLPLTKARQRRIEGALLRGETARVQAGQVGTTQTLVGVDRAYAADAARRGRLKEELRFPPTVSVPGESGADKALAAALEYLGCRVMRRRWAGAPGFRALHGGMWLEGWDEAGRRLRPERLLLLVSLVEFQNGSGKVAVPAMAPAALETLSLAWGGEVLRLGRDGEEAEERYAAMPWVRDAAFAACRLCARLALRGETLQALDGKAPLFTVERREVPLRGERGAVMEAFSHAVPEAEETGEGLRLHTGDGWVTVRPLLRRRALRLAAESFDAETARELCDLFSQKLEALDGPPDGEEKF